MCFLFPATDGVTLLLVLACCSFTGAHGQCDDARGHLTGHQLASMALAGLTCCVAQRHQPLDRAAKAGRPPYHQTEQTERPGKEREGTDKGAPTPRQKGGAGKAGKGQPSVPPRGGHVVGGRKEDVEWEGRKGQQRPARPASREEERKKKQEREGEEGQGAVDKGRTLDQELGETPIRRGSMASFAHWEVHTNNAGATCVLCLHNVEKAATKGQDPFSVKRGWKHAGKGSKDR